MEFPDKIVNFEYCKACAHWNKSEDEDPCFDCLDNPVNEYSHKPIHYSGNDILEEKNNANEQNNQ